MNAETLEGERASSSTMASERDYLADVPIVLTVSRLPQRLSEIPGAVTIVDREMIRMSGARDVADLLRFVPGFRVSNSFESNTPQGSYHTTMSDYSNHMQVMVDGRSVYSSYLQGGTGPGLQAVALEDIERIEVYRGSNSAAYGARAFLGSINIVTRDMADTAGVYAHVAGGDNGIADGMVRYGWGSDDARYRLSADTRSDYGLRGANGDISIQRLNLRSDLRLSNRDVLELRGGQNAIAAGVGFSGEDGNAPRTRRLETGFVQLDWKRALGVDEDVSVQLSHTEERLTDRFPYVPVAGLTIDFGGVATNESASAQHIYRFNPAVRMVWGGEWRQETVRSKALYNTDKLFSVDFSRVFGNVEWRPVSDVLLNLGGLYEYSTIAGTNVAPRGMVNWTVADGHTLRYGVSQAFRPPTIYEKYANIRYYVNGTLVDSTAVSRGNVSSEKVFARELGYLAELPGHALTLDVRAYEEQITGWIEGEDYVLPGSGNDNKAKDALNRQDFRIRGHEWQMKWRPWRDSHVIYGQSMIDSTQSVGNGAIRPVGSQFAMWMQTLPKGWHFSTSYYEIQAGHFPGTDVEAPRMSRTDARLAWDTRLAGRRAEWSVVLQNWGGSYPDYFPSTRFVQQTYLMLRLEN